jgi:Ca2+-dependent lipid-binding protein
LLSLTRMQVGVTISTRIIDTHSSASGTSDSYAVLRLGRRYQRSRINKSSLNPVWEETFRLIVDDIEDKASAQHTIGLGVQLMQIFFML